MKNPNISIPEEIEKKLEEDNFKKIDEICKEIQIWKRMEKRITKVLEKHFNEKLICNYCYRKDNK